MIALVCATVALRLAAWDSLETKLSTAATGYTLRNGMVPSSAPQATIRLAPHGDVAPESVVFYRDTNAWCPFCERVYLYLLEADINHEQTFVDISPGNKPAWYKEIIPTGQTPSISLGGKALWESNDIIEALESALDRGEQSGTSLLPSAGPDRERVLAELRTLDDPESGLKIGSAGYVYMRGGSFGEEPPEDGSNLPALREAFFEALRSLEARLSVTPGPYFEEDFGVLDIALWPSLERQAAGLPAFRSYELRGSQEFTAVSAWLEAMDHRPAVRAVASDDGTLVRLFSRVFGMGGGAPPADAAAAFGGDDATEAAAKLVRNRAAVAADIVKSASLVAVLLPAAARGPLTAPEARPLLLRAARSAQEDTRSIARAAWMCRRNARRLAGACSKSPNAVPATMQARLRELSSSDTRGHAEPCGGRLGARRLSAERRAGSP